MTLPASGPLSFSDINIEEHISSTYMGSLNDFDVRSVAGILSGQISFSNFYGKTAVTSITYSNPGTYNLVIPRGVTLIYVTVVGAGGGAGGNNTNGDIIGASGGGSGGYYQNISVAVTSGETLTLSVGYGGYGGNYRFNSSTALFNNTYPDFTQHISNPGADYNGGAGGPSTVYRGATALVSATGGAGGIQNWSSGGVGGYPNGVAGCNRPSGYPGCVDLGTCGINALGIGNGGGAYGCAPGRPGDPGRIILSW